MTSPRGCPSVSRSIRSTTSPVPPRYQQDPIHTLLTSLRGSQSLLELARGTGARIFQSSTSEVYGDPEIHPQPEDYRGRVNPVGPRACYDEGKRCAEALFFDFHRQYGVEIKVGRIFNTYGPHMRPDDGRVVSNFIVQALLNQPLTVYGDGHQTRSLCYVDDLLDLMLRFMEGDSTFTGPLNMGNPQELTVLGVAELVLELTGSHAAIIRRPLPVDDPMRRCPDIAMAREHFGWEPKVSFRDGLAETIIYFDGLLRRQRRRMTGRRRSRSGVAADAWEVSDE
jgi:UDP-glucuronate decarboxylase